MNVFLNADDCKIIAPYIEIPRDWEWWWIYHGDPCRWILENWSNDDDQHPGNPKPKDYYKNYPAIDTQLLGTALRWPIICRTMEGNIYHTENGDETFFYKKSELENRRDAMMYLIDNNLIEKVRK